MLKRLQHSSTLQEQIHNHRNYLHKPAEHLLLSRDWLYIIIPRATSVSVIIPAGFPSKIESSISCDTDAGYRISPTSLRSHQLQLCSREAQEFCPCKLQTKNTLQHCALTWYCWLISKTPWWNPSSRHRLRVEHRIMIFDLSDRV